MKLSEPTRPVQSVFGIPLYAVAIDCNCGHGSPDWQLNSVPKPLFDALEEAADCRLKGFPSKVELCF